MKMLSLPTPDYTQLNSSNNYSNNKNNVGLGSALNAVQMRVEVGSGPPSTFAGSGMSELSYTKNKIDTQTLLDKLRSIRLPTKQEFLSDDADDVNDEDKRLHNTYDPIYHQQMMMMGQDLVDEMAVPPQNPSEKLFDFVQWSQSPPGKRPTFSFKGETAKDEKGVPIAIDPRLVMGLRSASTR